jgi:cytochrome c-type biogenesis protein CcmH/NrfF
MGSNIFLPRSIPNEPGTRFSKWGLCSSRYNALLLVFFRELRRDPRVEAGRWDRLSQRLCFLEAFANSRASLECRLVPFVQGTHATKYRGDLALGVRHECFMKRRSLMVLALPSLVLGACAQASSSPYEGSTNSRAIEARLRAPCCWVQTLDVHESELATNLRAEIHERLQRGEKSVTIEDDLVVRYGERIRAVPRDEDPMDFIPAVIGTGMMTSLLGLALVVRRWRRRAIDGVPRAETNTEPANSKKDEYDVRIDDELAQLEDW